MAGTSLLSRQQATPGRNVRYPTKSSPEWGTRPEYVSYRPCSGDSILAKSFCRWPRLSYCGRCGNLPLDECWVVGYPTIEARATAIVPSSRVLPSMSAWSSGWLVPPTLSAGNAVRKRRNKAYCASTTL